MLLPTLIILLFAFSKAASSVHYTASVVEYNHLFNPNISEFQNLQTNVDMYESIIKRLGNKVDIVVFPENGLVGSMKGGTVFVEVPEPSWEAPDLSKNPILNQLSSAAKMKKVYVVVNLYEQSGTKRYNTNVVFRRNGTIATRYRKTNLFSESFLDVPTKPNIAYFETDFGVTFGTFICFDILFADPALDMVKMGIKDFVFSTHWFSQLPFLSAIQMQKGWSVANKVNLLASGYNNVSTGSMGSGIYGGHEEDVAISNWMGLPSTYKQSIHDGTFVITEVLETKSLSDETDNSERPVRDDIEKYTLYIDSNKRKLVIDEPKFQILTENLESYQKIPIPSDNDRDTKCFATMGLKGEHNSVTCRISKTMCHNNVCCHFNVTMKHKMADEQSGECEPPPEKGIENYFHLFPKMLVAFGGVRDFSGFATGGQDLCGIITCPNNKCGSVPSLEEKNPVLPFKWYRGLKLCTYEVEELNIVKGINGDSKEHQEEEEKMTFPSIILGYADGDSDVFGILPTDPASGVTNLSLTSKELYMKGGLTVGTAALVTRVFSRDGQSPTAPSRGGIQTNIWFKTMALAAIIACFMKYRQ